MSEMEESVEDKATLEDLNNVVNETIRNFIAELRDLGQTEIIATGPGYEIQVKIKSKDPQ